jgi:hypothetical protein
MKVKYTFLVLMTGLALVTSACGGGVAATEVPAGAETEAPVATEAQGANVLHIGWLGIPDTLNPAYAFLSEAYVL